MKYQKLKSKFLQKLLYKGQRKSLDYSKKNYNTQKILLINISTLCFTEEKKDFF